MMTKQQNSTRALLNFKVNKMVKYCSEDPNIWDGVQYAKYLVGLFKEDMVRRGYDPEDRDAMLYHLDVVTQERQHRYSEYFFDIGGKSSFFEPYEKIVGFRTYSNGYMSYREDGWYSDKVTSRVYTDAPLVYLTKQEFAYLWFSNPGSGFASYLTGNKHDLYTAIESHNFWDSMIEAGFGRGQHSTYCLMDRPRVLRNRQRTLRSRERRRKYKNDM